MVDKPKLDQMLSNLGRYTRALRDLAGIPRDIFLADTDKIGNAKYHFVIAAECCIDIANHIIASENLRFPKDNADSFAVLAESGLIDPGFRTDLAAMSRFRNRLVHLYWEVGDDHVYEYLQSSLDDLDRFGQAIAGHDWGE